MQSIAKPWRARLASTQFHGTAWMRSVIATSVIEFVSAASLVMMHLSRLAEDIILYATTEFGFFELRRCGRHRFQPDAAKEES